jgi:hypothetical protein
MKYIDSKAVRANALKLSGRVELQFPSFFTLALDGGEWSASQPGHFSNQQRTAGTY